MGGGGKCVLKEYRQLLPACVSAPEAIAGGNPVNGVERGLPTMASAPLAWTRRSGHFSVSGPGAAGHTASRLPPRCLRSAPGTVTAAARPLHLLENLDPDCGPTAACMGLERVPSVAGRPLQSSLCFHLIAALSRKKLYYCVVLKSSI